jgi:hypothetical protein
MTPESRQGFAGVCIQPARFRMGPNGVSYSHPNGATPPQFFRVMPLAIRLGISRNHLVLGDHTVVVRVHTLGLNALGARHCWQEGLLPSRH